MSDKMTCPACDARGSSVLDDFENGRPCRYCGVSASATEEILAARRWAADADMTARYEAKVKELDAVQRELSELRWRVRQVESALKSEPPSW